jgi:hypothetical protein
MGLIGRGSRDGIEKKWIWWARMTGKPDFKAANRTHTGVDQSF